MENSDTPQLAIIKRVKKNSHSPSKRTQYDASLPTTAELHSQALLERYYSDSKKNDRHQVNCKCVISEKTVRSTSKPPENSSTAQPGTLAPVPPPANPPEEEKAHFTSEIVEPKSPLSTNDPPSEYEDEEAEGTDADGSAEANPDTTPVPRETQGQATLRKFQEYWLIIFPWLHVERDQTSKEVLQMFCTPCRTHKTGKTSFSRGTSHFKKNIIDKHLGSKAHARAIESILLFGNLKKQLQPKLSRKVTVSDAYKLIRVVLFIVEQNISFIKYEKILELIQDLGIKLKSSLYLSRYGFQDLLRATSKMVKERVRVRLTNQRGFSILCDTATDITGVNYMIIFVLFYDTKNHVIRCELLDFVEVQRATGRAMFDYLERSLRKFGLDFENLMCLTTDGAAANMGQEKGLAGCIKEVNPRLLSVHCISHRLHLLTTDCIEEVGELSDINVVLNEMHTFFKRSYLRNNCLKLWGSILNEEAYRILETLEVRWFSYYRALKNIRRNLRLLAFSLKDLAKLPLETSHEPNGNTSSSTQNEQSITTRKQNQAPSPPDKKSDDTSEKAEKLLSKLSSFTFLASLHLVEDIFTDLDSVNQHFQQTYVSPLKIMPMIHTLKHKLHSSYLDGNMGITLRAFLDKITKVQGKDNMYEFEGFEFYLNYSLEEEAFMLMDAIVRKLMRSIDDRFPDANILTNASVFSLEKICHAFDVDAFGEKEVESLGNLYGDPTYNKKGEVFVAYLHRERLMKEWKSFKVFVVANYSMLFVQKPTNTQILGETNIKDRDAKELSLLNGIIINYEETYPNLIKLLTLLLSFSGSNAVSERGFSLQHLIKSKSRNLLETKNLKRTMRISCFDGKYDEEDYNRVVEIFNSMTKRQQPL
jgi:hypothetical protein